MHSEMFCFCAWCSDVSVYSVVLQREAQYNNKAYSHVDLSISGGLLFQRSILNTHFFLLATLCDVDILCVM